MNHQTELRTTVIQNGAPLPTLPAPVSRMRQVQCEQPLRSYELLASTDQYSSKRVRLADKMLQHGWVRHHYAPVDLTPPLDWEHVCASDRSWAFHLHSFDPLSSILAVVAHGGHARSYFERALDLALDWVTNYPSRCTPSEFAWYDMAVGLRAYRLAYLTDLACRDPEVPDEAVHRLLVSLREHAIFLADDSTFPWHSNHGFYVAAGQLALASRFSQFPESSPAIQQGHDRLIRLLDSQFNEEGVHREHSPDYHRMVLSTFKGLLDADLLADSRLEARHMRAAEALAWFITPDDQLVTFGDSDARDLHEAAKQLDTETATRVVAQSNQRDHSPALLRAFPDAGYLIARSEPGTPRERSYHLAFNCAFHSRTHKHADDLSFTWFDRGLHLLIDPGRYGYIGRIDPGSELSRQGFWYSDPRRIYVESTRAHNTVEIDRQSYPRRGVRPYGSALQRWGHENGIIFSEGHVRHFGTIRHARVLIFRPSAWVLVFDWLWDNGRAAHDFAQHFQVASALRAERLRDVVRIPLPVGSDDLFIVPLLSLSELGLAYGQEEPRFQGWHSTGPGRFDPSWTVTMSKGQEWWTTFATLLRFAPSPPTPDHGFTSTSHSGRRAKFRWTDQEGCTTVDMERPKDGDLRVRASTHD